VPDDLDGVACRALGIPGRHGGGPLRTPDELVTALGSTQGTARLPVADPSPATARERSGGAGYSAPYDDQGPARRRPGAATLGWVLAALVLVAGLVLAGSQVMTILDGDTDDASSGQGDEAAAGEPAKHEVKPIKIVKATTLDPPPQGTGEENDDRAALAIDDDTTGTAWNTQSYNDQFGRTGLKFGVGLVLDLGSPHDVSKVAVRVDNGATDLEIRVADRKGTSLDDYTLVKEQANVFPRTTVRLGEPVNARYVLVWLTSLPPYQGRFRGDIANVVVSG
jgi:hypothetical protein